MSATLTIPQVAELLGVSRNTAYETARRDGQLAGVAVLRVGRRILIPAAPFRAALGLDAEREPELAPGNPVQ